MPRDLLRAPGHNREKSLGWLAVAWMEHFCVHGPGQVKGMPIVHGDEYTFFVVDCYALGDHPSNNHMLYDSAFLSRPKGCDKSGLAARLALFEALGPCRFAGWAKGGEVYEDPWGLGFRYVYQPGEPMGKRPKSPMVRCMATEIGQPLALDTPVPTPAGWTTVGELKIGDHVFDHRGLPVVVARETPVMRDLDCYEVNFSDGEKVVASASHQWTMERRTGKGTRFEQVTVTTQQLAQDYLRGGAQGGTSSLRYRLPAGVGWQLPEQSLPVDPYLLGLWLGDGKSRDAGIAVCESDRAEVEALIAPLVQEHEEVVWEEIRRGCVVMRLRRRQGLCPWGHQYGDDVTHRSCGPCRRGEPRAEVRLGSMRERLRDIGVLGGKHIPERYLRASAEQRLALLQGLVDSDGHIKAPTATSKTGQAVFTNANRALIEGVEELLTSLGYKWSEQPVDNGAAWRVLFTPCATQPVARLSRKVLRHNTLTDGARSRVRHVSGVVKVAPVPVKCIGIDTEEHLFLVGRRAVPTHNTGNVYETILYNLNGDDEDDTPPLLSLIPGVQAGLELALLPGSAKIRRDTASASAKDGGKETFVVFDESHLYDTAELRSMYRVVTRNLKKRKKVDGTWYIETTTMFQPGSNSVAELTYTEADLLREGRKRHGRWRLMYDHRWGECKKISDEETLRTALIEAYGDALEWMDLEGLVDEFYDSRNEEADSRRYFLNARTSASDAWLREHEWNACKRPGSRSLQPGDFVTLGFDGGRTNDATALVAVRVEDMHVQLLDLWERPENAPDDWAVDPQLVHVAVAKAMSTYKVAGFYADPPYWQSYVDVWSNEWGDKMQVVATRAKPLEWWTNRERATSAALERFHTAVQDQLVGFTPWEDRDPESHEGRMIVALKRHILNARRAPLRGNLMLIRKEHHKSKRKIDAAMAAVLAFECASDAVAQGAEPPRETRYVPKRIR